MDNETLKFIFNQKLIKKTGQVFVFVSAREKEGKTFSCLKVAEMCLETFTTEKKIAIVDFNLTHPEITQKMQNPSIGWATANGDSMASDAPENSSNCSVLGKLYDRLENDAPENSSNWSYSFPSTDHPNLFFIPVGRIPDGQINTNALSEIFPKTLKILKKKFDIILVDGPAIMTSLATLTDIREFDGVFMVIEAGKTRRQVVSTAIKHLEDTSINIMGVIMNRRRHYIPNFIYKNIF